MKVEVAVLGSPPPPPVPNSPYGLCGRKATLDFLASLFRAQELCKKRWAPSQQKATLVLSELRSCVNVEVDVLGSLPLIDSPYSLCGRKAKKLLLLNI